MTEVWREVANDHPPEELDDLPPERMLESQQPGEVLTKCKRCGKWFKGPGEYGPTCARKMAGQHALEDGTIEVRDAQGERTAVIV